MAEPVRIFSTDQDWDYAQLSVDGYQEFLQSTPTGMAHTDYAARVAGLFFDGTPKRGEWQAPSTSLVPGKTPDFWSIDCVPGAFAVSENVFAKLYPFIGSEVEVLPVKCVLSDLLIINVINIIDWWDQESSVWYYGKKKQRVSVRQYAIREGTLDRTFLFKSPGFHDESLCCTAAFVYVVQQLGLKGILFNPLNEPLPPWEQ